MACSLDGIVTHACLNASQVIVSQDDLLEAALRNFENPEADQKIINCLYMLRTFIIVGLGAAFTAQCRGWFAAQQN